ncbi:MAG: restriction endonuclease subunit S [Candidatus Methanomethylophilaceae archaeon]|jgi:type I restriction enzyme S subunit|nr:restriction endonuclease subunit S [Candidatus Methanomethylophilaceae archaeon]
MNNWKCCLLGDILTLQRGHDLTYRQTKNGDIPVVGSNGIIAYHDTPTTKAPCVTIGRSGNIGHAFYYDCDCWAHNTVLYVKDFKGTHPKFAYYLLKSMSFGQYNAGSAVPTLNRNHIHSIEIKYPPLPVQKKIASILSSLDDKIELNTRMNNVLEEIARALFRRWFVAFEFPDNEGKPYKSAGGKMVESEIGRVPEGWEILSLDKIANFMNGMACQKYPPKEGEESMPVIKIRELRSGNLNETDRVSHHVPEKYYVQNGDVLFSWSGSLMVDIWTSGEGVLNQHLFKVTSNTYQKWFYYFWTKYHLEEFQNIAVDKATTMGHIQRKHLNQAKVIVPNKDTLKRMDMVMVPIIAQIIQNNLEGNVLSELRDELLPKLMSGELSL